jgi:hypothetical protein
MQFMGCGPNNQTKSLNYFEALVPRKMGMTLGLAVGVVISSWDDVNT